MGAAAGNVCLGIDLGGSSFKVAAVAADRRGGVPSDPGLWGLARSDAGDPAAVGPLVDRTLAALGADPARVGLVALTGVGAAALLKAARDGGVAHAGFLSSCTRVPEFQAVGRGGLFTCRVRRAVVMSAGTGTSLVLAGPGGTEHLGGSGVGGGFLCGACAAATGEADFPQIQRLSARGDRRRVDLMVGDLLSEPVPGLRDDLTAANLGRAGRDSDPADLASGLANAVFETTGMMAVMACKGTDVRDVCAIGSLAASPQARQVYATLADLHGLRFHVPERPAYAAAMGAVVSSL